MNISENIQMYLVELAILNESSDDSLITLSSLAEALEVQPVSVNQMIHKLDESGLVEYKPYKGVSLTIDGHDKAMNILRHRRLWEVFLVKNLGFDSDLAEELACRIEHVTTEEIGNRLSAFLKHPNLSPLGKLIPSKDIKFELEKSLPLSSLSVGQEVVVLELPDDQLSMKFFQDAGLHSGSIVKILATDQGRNMLIETNNTKIHLADSLCTKIKAR